MEQVQETPVDPKDHSKPAERKRVKETVVLVTKDARTGKTLQIVEVGPNLVTDAGDRYYAQRGAVEAVTHTFSIGEIVVAQSGLVNSKTRTFGAFKNMNSTYTGRKTFAAGYPKTADSDTDNSGRTIDAVTYKTIFGTTEANYTIRAVGISRSGGATNSDGQLLSYKTLAIAAYVQKTSSITLTVYINHTFLGV